MVLVQVQKLGLIYYVVAFRPEGKKIWDILFDFNRDPLISGMYSKLIDEDQTIQVYNWWDFDIDATQLVARARDE